MLPKQYFLITVASLVSLSLFAADQPSSQTSIAVEKVPASTQEAKDWKRSAPSLRITEVQTKQSTVLGIPVQVEAKTVVTKPTSTQAQEEPSGSTSLTISNKKDKNKAQAAPIMPDWLKAMRDKELKTIDTTSDAAASKP